ncbi:MAG: hypothetical protein ACRDC4_16265, partial [Plesiomonas sp.]
ADFRYHLQYWLTILFSALSAPSALPAFFELAIFRFSLFFRFLSTHNEPASARSRYFDCICANICRNAMQECYQSAKITYAALPVCFICQSANNGADYVS